MAHKLGLIAGLGQLPIDIASKAKESGQGVYVLRIDGFVEPGLEDFEGEIVGIGEVGKQLKLLKAAKCQEIVFAGVVKRPDFSKLKLDMRGARLLPKVLAASKRGDDALLRTLVDVFEKEGFYVRGADEVREELLAGGGVIFGAPPEQEVLEDLKRAAKVASVVGAEDIGQGCVVTSGLVIAVEAQEGTDEMLRRVAEMAGAKGGVLVKRPKPIQERRIDLPTIGPSTIESAAKAGLVCIGLEARGALILDQSACRAAAEKYGISVFGFPVDWPGV